MTQAGNSIFLWIEKLWFDISIRAENKKSSIAKILSNWKIR